MNLYNLSLRRIKMLNEMKLSKFWEQQQNKSFGIITAFRGEYTNAINQERNRELINDLRHRGFSVSLRLKGYFKENYKTPQEKDVRETSFLIFAKQGINGDMGKHLLGVLKKLGEKYNQDSILFKPVDEDDAYLYGTSPTSSYPEYGKVEAIGKFRPEYIGEFYSRMRGKPFVFTNDLKSVENTVEYKRRINSMSESKLVTLELELPKGLDRMKDIPLVSFDYKNILESME